MRIAKSPFWRLGRGFLWVVGFCFSQPLLFSLAWLWGCVVWLVGWALASFLGAVGGHVVFENVIF